MTALRGREPHAPPRLRKAPSPAGGRRKARTVVDGPLRAFALVTTAIFGLEFLLMWFLRGTHSLTTPARALLDAGALLVVMVPLLYFLFVLPMTRGLREKTRVEKELLAIRAELERRVEERTAELEATNRSLRREAEERSKADERVRFQARVLDAVDQAVAVTDPEGTVVYWNRFAERLYGWPQEEAVGRPLAELTPFAEPGRGELDTLALCHGRGNWAGDAETVRRDGTRFPAYLVCAALRDAEGSLSGCAHVSLDASARKAAEEALRYSEEKYSVLVENSPTGIFIVRDGRIAFANPKLCRMLGYTPDELRGVAALDLVAAEDRGDVAEIGRKRLAAEEVPEEYECRLVTRTGEVRWVTLRNILVPFRGGTSVLGNVVDVTQRRAAEEELRRSTLALRRLSARLLTSQEEERRRVARELHDSIGQSLSAVKFVVESALSDEGHRGRSTAMLQKAVVTIQGAVEEVRRISLALRPSILDDLGLLATIGWFAREFETLHPGIRVDQKIEVAEAEVPAELKTVIFRILQEGLTNVAKHSGARRATLSLRREEGSLAFLLEDDGRGLGARPAPAAEPGNGAGLRNMKERAELSGGTFCVKSERGNGTALRATWRLGTPPSYRDTRPLSKA